MIWLSPYKSFFDDRWGDESEKCIKIQIENSIHLGWKEEDIILVTNFEFQYQNVKSIVVPDYLITDIARGTPSKINALVYLFEQELIEDDIYWFHDLDAFQLKPIEIDIEKNCIYLTDYGVCQQGPSEYKKLGIKTKKWSAYKQWSTGSIFFGKHTYDIFKNIVHIVNENKINEEWAIAYLIRDKKSLFERRINKINISYNFALEKRDILTNYEKVTDLPIKVIHFHPADQKGVYYFDHPRPSPLNVCRGDNPMRVALMPERIRILFRKHGF